MKKKSIAIDMDGVLADTTEQFFIWETREKGQRSPFSSIIGKSEREAFDNIRQWVFTEGFFRDIPVMPHAHEVVAELHKKYDIFIVSAAMEFPQSLIEKYHWLQAHFPYISWRNIVLCGSKAIIKTDIMIDDHFKNLDTFEGETYLFNCFHNLLADAGRHKRVQDWQEIATILL